MNRAMQAIATIVALIFLGAALYVGMSGSWVTAIVLFLVAGGVEFMAYALGAGSNPEKDE